MPDTGPIRPTASALASCGACCLCLRRRPGEAWPALAGAPPQPRQPCPLQQPPRPRSSECAKLIRHAPNNPEHGQRCPIEIPPGRPVSITAGKPRTAIDLLTAHAADCARLCGWRESSASGMMFELRSAAVRYLDPASPEPLTLTACRTYGRHEGVPSCAARWASTLSVHRGRLEPAASSDALRR
jgi:hypothetical protein